MSKRQFEEEISDQDLIEAMEDYELAQALDHHEAQTTQMGGGSLLDFDLRPIGPRRNWKNTLNKQRFQARLRQHRQPTPRDNLGHELTGALQRTISRQIESDPSLSDDSRVNFTFQSDAFSHAFQSTTFTVQEFRDNSNRLVDYLGSLAQKLNSNEEFSLDDTFTMETTFIHMPSAGSGRKNLTPGNEAVETLLSKKKSIIRIENEDQLCCARAIITMKARTDQHAKYKQIRLGRRIQTELARRLHLEAGVPEGPCGLPELQKFQDHLSNYQIKVLSVDKPHCVIFKGPHSDKKILLIKVDDHYHGCSSYGGFLNKSYFCHDCDRAYDEETHKKHPCNGKWCWACRRRDCQDFIALKQRVEKIPPPSLHCQACHRDFFGPACLTNHGRETDQDRSRCQQDRKCLVCKKEYVAAPAKKKKPLKPQHKCGYAKCPFCGLDQEIATHQCYIQPLAEEEDQRKTKIVSDPGSRTVVGRQDDSYVVEEPPPVFVYADYEAISDQDGVQHPILLCCETDDDDGVETFYGEHCTEDFFEFLDNLTQDQNGDQRKVIIIFHNFKGYDGMFIIQHLYQQHREVTNQITVGTKILSLTSGFLTFKDSLCFLPFPLASFPQTFGLQELKKGYFPHLFNTFENQEYRGTIPDQTFYDPDGMSKKKKADFEKWHDEKTRDNYHFVMKEEMVDYCISDVKLLKAGCQKFKREFQEHADFDPFEKCVTIASACNRFWRKKMLTPNTIAVEPPRGWHGATSNQSFKALQWLAWQEHQLHQQPGTSRAPAGDRIRHCHNGGEVRVLTPAQSFLVDGYDAHANTVYEFHGCLWHGCTTCFKHQRHEQSKLNKDRTFHEMREATLAKEEMLRNAGYTLKVIWECQWEKEKKENAPLQTFLQTLELTTPLEPGDAFFGGRTNASKLYHRVEEEGEEIRYVDVTSLYPFINATGEYPVGHPEIITNPTNQNISDYFGMAKVDVLPPYQLYHPVLPFRHGGKLTFPLCRTCVQQEMSKPLTDKTSFCPHTDQERMLRGTWCTPELLKAQEKGYTIVKIHEVWHFKSTQKGLFEPYVKKWLKIKQESSGYPRWVQTEDQKRKYIRNYQEKQGISLDYDNIEKNPGRKATAKMMLNSFWGKFGENLNKTQVLTISSPAELFAAVTDDLNPVQTIRICTDDKLEVVTLPLNTNQLDNGKRNIFVAAFTTCLARLKLYEYLDLLQKQVLYFDTDSVIYQYRPGQQTIPLGDYLGDMTDELEGQGFIEEFVSAGPKNYGYQTSRNEFQCKVRGFTLNVRGDKQLNYQVMKQNVLDEITHPLEDKRITAVHNPFFFTRHPTTKRIKIIPRTKQYSLVFDKRVVDTSTFETYPYGYHPSLDEQDHTNVEVLISL